jgi:lambda family phage portal protein
MHWLDQATLTVAPRWTFRRMRARAAAEVLARHYEAASVGRRTQDWYRSASDVNAVSAMALDRVRDVARDMVRNDPYAASALDTIVDHVVGWGIVGSASKDASKAVRAKTDALWKRWAETTACDADNRQDLSGLQKQIMRTVVTDGECLIRRRWRRPEDGLPIPMQLQLLEPDFLDTLRPDTVTENGHRIIQGVEFDLIGRRVAYYLFREHPGAQIVGSRSFGTSDRIPASEVLHVFKQTRNGQARAVSWFAPVILTMKDFAKYQDAALMKQLVAACLAVVTSDIDGSAPSLGTTTTEHPQIDKLEPGMILNVPPGRSVSVVDPPTINEHAAYSQSVLRAIATGIGISYEDLTGDYQGMPYSAARMSRIRAWARVEGWRWQMLIPQFCDPVWGWFLEAAQVMGLEAAPPAMWTAPPAPMIDPSAEGLAYQRNIRSGIITQSEALRERGYDPDAIFEEMADDNKKIDRLGLILDSDARTNTQAGLPRLLPHAELAERVDALGALIRAGYDPEDSLKAVGMPKIKHLGVPPVTVQAEQKKPAFGQPAAVPPNGNGNGKETAAAKELTAIRDEALKAIEFLKGTTVHANGNGHGKKPGRKKTTVARDEKGAITETIEETLPEGDGA